jgi:hypothetical protein
MAIPGPLLFARYAYPPNSLGYCGPGDHRALFEYAVADVVDPGLIELESAFAGAWPYLQLIAASIGGADPLAADVVEAYWVGNRLLDRIDPRWLAASLDDRFAARLGSARSTMTALTAAGGVPHHSFHVLAVSPWIGLLRAGFTESSLLTMDRCRIRTGVVVSLDDGTALVDTDRLTWDGEHLELAPGATEIVQAAADGYRLAMDLAPGDSVALHWDWVCDRLTPAQARTMERFTRRSLAVVNSVPAALLDTALT